MRELVDELKDIELAIFDLDGVIYRGDILISNSDKVIQELKDISIKVVYNSNNSTVTRKMYVDRLKGLNITSKESDFYTSASITSEEITNLKQNATIFVIGEIGLKNELIAKGHTIVNLSSNYKKVDFVIVGLDREFNYKKLAFAQNCLLEGKAQFYATNSDSTLPAASGLLPGAGVMVNAVETCTNRKPLKIFGKPNPYGIQMILNHTKVSPDKSVIFGDRLNTDILAGNRAGIKTVLVLTGVTTELEVKKIQEKAISSQLIDKNLIPKLVIKSLLGVFKE